MAFRLLEEQDLGAVPTQLQHYFLRFTKKDLLIFLFVCLCLCHCECVSHVCMTEKAGRGRQTDRLPKAEVPGCRELPGIGVGGGSNLGSPEEQQMLTLSHLSSPTSPTGNILIIYSFNHHIKNCEIRLVRWFSMLRHTLSADKLSDPGHTWKREEHSAHSQDCPLTSTCV